MTRHVWMIAAALWGFAEATLFFIVPDVILSYIGLKRGVDAAARASVLAAIGAAIGGALMFVWSVHDEVAAHAAVLAVPAISENMVARALFEMDDRGWFWATFWGPLSSTPYKVYAFWAPQVGAPITGFAMASVLARLPRFLIVSIGVALIGRALGGRVSPRLQTWLLIGAWVLFYAVFFALMPN